MKDTWDDLWKNKPTSQGIYFNQLDWEKKVKAEGDRLKKKLEAIKTHMKSYPDERDEKYIIGRAYPDTMGQTTKFNSVYFLTDLETWFNTFKETLGDQASTETPQ